MTRVYAVRSRGCRRSVNEVVRVALARLYAQRARQWSMCAWGRHGGIWIVGVPRWGPEGSPQAQTDTVAVHRALVCECRGDRRGRFDGLSKCRLVGDISLSYVHVEDAVDVSDNCSRCGGCMNC